MVQKRPSSKAASGPQLVALSRSKPPIVSASGSSTTPGTTAGTAGAANAAITTTSGSHGPNSLSQRQPHANQAISASRNTYAASKNASSGTSTRATFVDLSKLRKTSLKRYKKHFKLDVKADSKGELLAAVSAHFAAMPVREADVALEFYEFARTFRNKQQRLEPGLVENGPAGR